MGDHNSGGDGSMRWTTEVNRVRKVDGKPVVTSQAKGPNGWTQSGFDEDEKARDGDWITISVQVPKNFKTVDEYLAALKAGDDDPLWGVKRHPTQKRIYFNVKVETMEPSQVRISWGGSDNVIPPRGSAAR